MSVCNLIPRSLRPQSIMGTPLFSGDAFQWARFRNDEAFPVSFKCFHNSGLSNSFDLKTIARAAAMVDRKIFRVPKPRKESKIKHQRASWYDHICTKSIAKLRAHLIVSTWLKRGCQHPSNKFEILWQVAQNSFSLLLLYFVAQYDLIIVM